jgi:methylenetetrahydrofolate reductase (NADPH)
MRIIEMYHNRPFVFSIEIFPPKTDEGLFKLKKKLKGFAEFQPDFISVTYGAGGGTRQYTQQMAGFIRKELGLEVLAHLTCVSHTRKDVSVLKEQFLKEGVENIMALRGDPPSVDKSFEPMSGGYRYASELIEDLARDRRFGIGAAGYPETHIDAISAQMDRYFLKQKIERGAEFVISQFFLDNQKFLSWRDQLYKEGVRIPIIPGLICSQSSDQIQRFAKMCGCQVPCELNDKLKRVEGEAEDCMKVGLDHAVQQLDGLIKEGVTGVHLYALNRTEVVSELGQKMLSLKNRINFKTNLKDDRGLSL